MDPQNQGGMGGGQVRSAPRETAEKITNPGGVAAGSGDLRTAFGVRAPPHARSWVGAVAPTRGYRLQRLRRRGGRAGRGTRRVGAPGLQWEFPVASSQMPEPMRLWCVCYAGGVEAGSPGSRSAPREAAEKITNPGGVAGGSGDLRTAFGVRAPPHARPRVGAVAPTRGYRLQRLRRRGGRAGQGTPPGEGTRPSQGVASSQKPVSRSLRGGLWVSPGLQSGFW